jgi:photosystem II stability/assembly factor-like uncharacterized protein
MKKTILIALSIALALTFVSCPEDDDNNGGNGTGGSGGGGDNWKWTAVSNSTFGTSTINAIAYGNNRFVAVGHDGRMAYSTNGTSWKAVENSAFPKDYSGIIRAIAYGIADGTSVGRFVAGGAVGKMAYSDDNGEKWTAVSNSTFGTSQILGIAYGNNRFVVGGESGKMAYSANGTSWTAVSNSTFGTTSILDIAYGNNRFVAVGLQGQMAYSVNGEIWTAVSNSTFPSTYTIDSNTYAYPIYAIAYGIADGESVGRFVAVGRDGKMAYSVDNGVTWTAVSNPLSYYAIAYGNNRFVAVGDKGKIAYSDDNGETWTAVADSTFGTGYFDSINAIAFGNNRFVAVGYEQSGSFPNYTYTNKIAYADW